MCLRRRPPCLCEILARPLEGGIPGVPNTEIPPEEYASHEFD